MVATVTSGEGGARKVLVLNSGSSSLKWSLLDAATSRVEQEDDEAWESDEGAHEQALRAVLAKVDRVDAVGHRVVHGGARFHDAVVIDECVRADLDAVTPLAPLHNPSALAGIDAVSKALPTTPQVACFDTAFHHDMPAAAFLYALPRAWIERWSLRRYGFHGLSVAYAVKRTTDLLGVQPGRLVVCHLGSGSSITAVRDGRSVDNSMGFTPLEGVVMASRSGTVDPGLLLYLATTGGIALADLEKALNSQSGLKGLSSVSGDLRHVQKAAEGGDVRAAEAVAVMTHSIVRAVGGMVAVLGGLDALVFTGGVGEHSATVRSAVCAALGYTGLSLEATQDGQGDRDIAAEASPVRALVVSAREDLTVLGDVRRLLGFSGS